jgi:phage N-6-adenine-methyltransferase
MVHQDSAPPAAAISVCKSSERNDWETPPELFDALNREFGFTLDVCATAATAKCARYFTPSDNGLAQPWGTNTCWMNPPYGHLDRWMRKAYQSAIAGATVVCLVPVRSHTKWFHRLCVMAEVRFLRGRLRFVGSDGEAPFPQLLVIFRPGLGRPWVMKCWEWKPKSRQGVLFS